MKKLKTFINETFLEFINSTNLPLVDNKETKILMATWFRQQIHSNVDSYNVKEGSQNHPFNN